MEMITVSLSYKEIVLNSLLIAVLPVAFLLGVEYLATKRCSGAGLLLGAAIYLSLQDWLLFQTKGKVFVENGALHVQSGFYKAQWPLKGLSISAVDAAAMGGGLRVNGTAMYALRVGWFAFAGDRVFFLTTTDPTACVEREGRVVLCLDQDVVGQLGDVI
jgi:hypothetical protein